MSVDEILETISEMDDFEELMCIGKAFAKRHDYLRKLAMERAKKKFKMGDRITIKDEKGKVWKGIIRGFTKKHVRLIVGNAEIKVNPTDIERLEATVVEEK